MAHTVTLNVEFVLRRTIPLTIALDFSYPKLCKRTPERVVEDFAYLLKRQFPSYGLLLDKVRSGSVLLDISVPEPNFTLFLRELAGKMKLLIPTTKQKNRLAKISTITYQTEQGTKLLGTKEEVERAVQEKMAQETIATNVLLIDPSAEDRLNQHLKTWGVIHEDDEDVDDELVLPPVLPKLDQAHLAFIRQYGVVEDTSI